MQLTVVTGFLAVQSHQHSKLTSACFLPKFLSRAGEVSLRRNSLASLSICGTLQRVWRVVRSGCSS